MRVRVPFETAVYSRSYSHESFVLKHLSKCFCMKYLPLSLSVSDLSQHKNAEAQRKGVEDMPLLVLITGCRAQVYSMRNWNDPKKDVKVKPHDFPSMISPPSCEEIAEGWTLVWTFSTLTTFSTHCNQYRVSHHTAVVAACILIPRVLPERDIPSLEVIFQYIVDKGKSSDTWMLVDSSQKSVQDHFNESTRMAKKRRVSCEDEIPKKKPKETMSRGWTGGCRHGDVGMDATPTQPVSRGTSDGGTFEVSHIKAKHHMCKGAAPALNTPPSPPLGKRIKFF